LRDANGDLWNATYVTRLPETEIIPDLTNAQLAPGDRLSGAVVYAVPDGVDVTGFYLSPVSSQLLQLADLQGEMPSGVDEAVTEGDATPSEESASATAGDACAELAQWLAETRERIQRAAEMSVEDATLEDLDSLADHAAEYAALAEAQLAEAVPADAVAANKALAATFNAYSGAIQKILEAESSDDPALKLTEAMNTFNGAGQRIHAIEGELTRVASNCGLT